MTFELDFEVELNRGMKGIVGEATEGGETGLKYYSIAKDLPKDERRGNRNPKTY